MARPTCDARSCRTECAALVRFGGIGSEKQPFRIVRRLGPRKERLPDSTNGRFRRNQTSPVAAATGRYVPMAGIPTSIPQGLQCCRVRKVWFRIGLRQTNHGQGAGRVIQRWMSRVINMHVTDVLCIPASQNALRPTSTEVRRAEQLASEGVVRGKASC